MYQTINEKITLRKYLILRLRTKGKTQHYYVFLTDEIKSNKGNKVYLIVSLSSSDKNYDGTYTIDKDHSLHPDLPPVDGFVSFKDAKVMTGRDILNQLAEHEKPVLDYNKTNKKYVDEILGLIPNSGADDTVKGFYNAHIKI